MFVLKSGAGFSIFKWIAFLASDFLNQSRAGAEFFFDADTVYKDWFFVNTVGLTNQQIPALFSQSLISVACCYHFLHRIRANDVLPWSDAMAYQGLVSICGFVTSSWRDH